MTAYFQVGEVLRPQGIRGEAKVRSFASDAENFRRWKTLYVRSGDEYRGLKVTFSRVRDGFVYLTLEGCGNPEDVEKYRGQGLYVSREDAGEPEEGQVYISDLIGCSLVSETGEVLGRVTDVLQYGPVDTYVFETPRGQMMAPALKSVFPETDVKGRVLSVLRERLNEVAVFED